MQYSFVKEEWGSLLWVDSPSVFHPQLLFTFHIPHMSYRHNLYHLTHVAYQTCNADGTFPKCPMEFHPKPISKIRENLPHEVWLLQAITHGLPAACNPGAFIKYPNSQSGSTNTIQIWLFQNQAMALVIKFNMNLQLCLLHKFICLAMRWSSFVGLFVRSTTMTIIILCLLA